MDVVTGTPFNVSTLFSHFASLLQIALGVLKEHWDVELMTVKIWPELLECFLRMSGCLLVLDNADTSCTPEVAPLFWQCIRLAKNSRLHVLVVTRSFQVCAGIDHRERCQVTVICPSTQLQSAELLAKLSGRLSVEAAPLRSMSELCDALKGTISRMLFEEEIEALMWLSSKEGLAGLPYGLRLCGSWMRNNRSSSFAQYARIMLKHRKRIHDSGNKEEHPLQAAWDEQFLILSIACRQLLSVSCQFDITSVPVSIFLSNRSLLSRTSHLQAAIFGDGSMIATDLFRAESRLKSLITELSDLSLIAYNQPHLFGNRDLDSVSDSFSISPTCREILLAALSKMGPHEAHSVRTVAVNLLLEVYTRHDRACNAINLLPHISAFLLKNGDACLLFGMQEDILKDSLSLRLSTQDERFRLAVLLWRCDLLTHAVFGGVLPKGGHLQQLLYKAATLVIGIHPVDCPGIDLFAIFSQFHNRRCYQDQETFQFKTLLSFAKLAQKDRRAEMLRLCALRMFRVSLSRGMKVRLLDFRVFQLFDCGFVDDFDEKPSYRLYTAITALQENLILLLAVVIKGEGCSPQWCSERRAQCCQAISEISNEIFALAYRQVRKDGCCERQRYAMALNNWTPFEKLQVDKNSDLALQVMTLRRRVFHVTRAGADATGPSIFIIGCVIFLLLVERKPTKMCVAMERMLCLSRRLVGRNQLVLDAFCDYVRDCASLQAPLVSSVETLD